MKLSLFFSLYALFSIAATKSVENEENEHASLEERQFGGIGSLIPALLGLGIVAGALGSYNAKSGECKCALPRCDGGNACECLNTAAVQCWVSARGECKLSLNTCRNEPNAAPTDPKSQFPPCLPNGGPNGALPPCAATSRCAKVDNSCNDWSFSRQGGCIGICVPKSITAGTQQPKQPTQPKQSPPPKQQPPQQQIPPSWGGGAPSAPNNAGGGPPSYGSCPANVRCPGNNLCTPDPRNKNTFLCIQPNETCGGFQDVRCAGGKICVADPRISCAGFGCGGLCL
ncbi:hypothetical protein EJ08DRAFT_702909 [Tothia fuscella]|uniref:Uncharacterized protein n=1 Tax=Tothia fuscella TaxID=1048955 RepID=A0A9P4TT98_9PEZI|nr:hypothetical protein EJ08DRAFT_702909 [Tothia fuscella]